VFHAQTDRVRGESRFIPFWKLVATLQAGHVAASLPVLALQELDELKWIHARALDGQSPMEVWPCDASCRSHSSKHLAKFQVVSELHVNFGKVTVEGVNAETVINDDSVARKKQFLCENHSSILSRVNKGSGRGRKIHATVRRAGLAV
jgi:hypothetical protein